MSAKKAAVLVLAALLLASGAGCKKLINMNKPIEYLSMARVVVAGTVALNSATSDHADARHNFLGTQMELIKSGEVRRRALERIEATHPDVSPVPVELKVSRTRDSSVVNLAATGGEPEYVQVYLNAVLDEYINFLSELKENASDPAIKKITEELLRLERELKSKEKDLTEVRSGWELAKLVSQKGIYEKVIAGLHLRIAELKSGPGNGEAAEATVIASQIAGLEKEIEGYEAKLAEVIGELSRMRTLVKGVDATREKYETLLKALREIDLAGNDGTGPSVNIMERATLAVPTR